MCSLCMQSRGEKELETPEDLTGSATDVFPFICGNIFSPPPGDSTLGSEHRSRVMPVQHVDGPVDGNLYAKVTKTSTSSSASNTRLANGGPGFQPNGPLNMSHDSGISSSAGMYNYPVKDLLH